MYLCSFSMLPKTSKFPFFLSLPMSTFFPHSLALLFASVPLFRPFQMFFPFPFLSLSLLSLPPPGHSKCSASPFSLLLLSVFRFLLFSSSYCSALSLVASPSFSLPFTSQIFLHFVFSLLLVLFQYYFSFFPSLLLLFTSKPFSFSSLSLPPSVLSLPSIFPSTPSPPTSQLTPVVPRH